jgi:predicted regulator of amino acid metabolism with ACT domain
MLVKAINLAIAFFTLNKGVKANAKSIVSEAMDIGVAISKIAKTQKVDKKTKNALLKEVKEFNKAITKFLDDLVIPD